MPTSLLFTDDEIFKLSKSLKKNPDGTFFNPEVIGKACSSDCSYTIVVSLEDPPFFIYLLFRDSEENLELLLSKRLKDKVEFYNQVYTLQKCFNARLVE